MSGMVWGSIPSRNKKFFFSPKHPDWPWGATQPPIEYVLRFFTRGKEAVM